MRRIFSADVYRFTYHYEEEAVLVIASKPIVGHEKLVPGERLLVVAGEEMHILGYNKVIRGWSSFPDSKAAHQAIFGKRKIHSGTALLILWKVCRLETSVVVEDDFSFELIIRGKPQIAN